MPDSTDARPRTMGPKLEAPPFKMFARLPSLLFFRQNNIEYIENIRSDLISNSQAHPNKYLKSISNKVYSVDTLKQ